MLSASCRDLCGVIPRWRRAPLVSVGAGKPRARPRRGAHAPHPTPHRQQERTGGRVWEVGTPRSGGRATPFPLSFLPGCGRSPWEVTLLGLGLHGGRRASCSASHSADHLKMGNSAEDVAGTSHTRAPSVRLGSPGGAARPLGALLVGWGVKLCSQRLRDHFQPPAAAAAGRAPPPRTQERRNEGALRAGARQTRGRGHVRGERLALQENAHRQTRKSTARRSPDERWEPGM